ncbi:MAG TPA: hypothetical protein VKN18_27610 [Blastocatellia bacterium]|nr:hypothetical protein [Blastocatellia bacterium]
MSISARNHLKGKITDLKLGDVMAHITIKVGQNIIESVNNSSERRGDETQKRRYGDRCREDNRGDGV